MMFSSTTCRFVACFLSLSLLATAETVRGSQRELEDKLLTVYLGTAADYTILASSGITTTGVTYITGDIAVSPIAASAMTGFALIADSTNVFSMSELFSGKAFAADYAPPTPAVLTTAVGDMGIAYIDAKGRPNSNAARINIGGGILGANPGVGHAENALSPGIYTFSTSVNINGDIYFEGGADDIFIIQMTGSLTVAANKKVVLQATDAGTPKAENIFWQIATFIDMGAGAHMEGILLTKTAAIFQAGSSLNGRVLTQTAATLNAVTMVPPPVVADSA
jgi:hypothetical protein